MSVAPGVALALADIALALADIVGPQHVVVTGPADGDGGGLASLMYGTPDVIVYPGTTTEVAEVLRGAAACDITARTSDGTVLRDGDAGEIVIAPTRLNRIVEIVPATLTARVQPWIPDVELLRRLAEAGLQPARLKVRDRRGRCVELGESVIGVEAVSVTGQIVRAESAQQDPCDIADLLLRSAGVSCLVTEITLALSPRMTRG